MCDLETFKIDLKALKQGETLLTYKLNDSFFAALDAPEVQRGELEAVVSVNRNTDFFEFNFDIKGSVCIACNLCLDDMQQPIDTKERLIVKFGTEYTEDGELVTIDESDGILYLSWFIYEFIALAIPIKHVHAPGECNAAMAAMLDAHTAGARDNDDKEQHVDPRWMKLKEIKNNIKD